MKVSVMGETLSDEEIAMIPEPQPELSAYFSEATVSQEALDLASRYVPQDYWKGPGLHTWLTRRANEAWKQIKVGERTTELGRLRYRFDFINDKPVLASIALLPPREP